MTRDREGGGRVRGGGRRSQFELRRKGGRIVRSKLGGKGGESTSRWDEKGTRSGWEDLKERRRVERVLSSKLIPPTFVLPSHVPTSLHPPW